MPAARDGAGEVAWHRYDSPMGGVMPVAAIVPVLWFVWRIFYRHHIETAAITGDHSK